MCLPQCRVSRIVPFLSSYLQAVNETRYQRYFSRVRCNVRVRTYVRAYAHTDARKRAMCQKNTYDGDIEMM